MKIYEKPNLEVTIFTADIVRTSGAMDFNDPVKGDIFDEA